MESTSMSRCYRAEMSRTSVGSPILKIIPNNPRGIYARERQMAAAIYEVAAELERKLDPTGTRCALAPYASEGRLVVELSEHGLPEPVEKIIEQVLIELNFR